MRLSGTGSEGATIRLYVEKYETVSSPNDLFLFPTSSVSYSFLSFFFVLAMVVLTTRIRADIILMRRRD